MPDTYNVWSGDYIYSIGSELFLNSCLTEPAPDGKYSNGSDCYTVSGGAGVISAIAPCGGGTTTTTTLQYDYYYASKYDCTNSCSLEATNVLVAFPTGSGVSIGSFYIALNPDIYSYQITASGAPSGGLIMYQSTFATCQLACSV